MYKADGRYQILLVVGNGVAMDSEAMRSAEALHSNGFDVLVVELDASNQSRSVSREIGVRAFPVIVLGMAVGAVTGADADVAAGNPDRHAIIRDRLADLIQRHEPRFLHTQQDDVLDLVSQVMALLNDPDLVWLHDGRHGEARPFGCDRGEPSADSREKTVGVRRPDVWLRPTHDDTVPTPEDPDTAMLEVYAAKMGLGRILTASALAMLDPSKRKASPFARRRVLHGPSGSAGQPRNLATAINSHSKKCVAETLLTRTTQFGYTSDLYAGFRRLTPQARLEFLTRLSDDYDIFHFHGCSFLWDPPEWRLPSLMDLAFLKARGCRIVFHFRGTELRSPEMFAALNPHAYSHDDPYGFALKYNDASQARMLAALRPLVDRFCVVDPELQSYLPEARIVNRVLDDSWQPVATDNARPLVVHAPSRPEIKGTSAILKAVETLQAEGLAFDFKLVSGMSHAQARTTYEAADIIVDQLRIGWYGVLAVEGMALGKAVISYIRKDLLDTFDGTPPVAAADPDTITEVLRRLIQDAPARRRQAEAGLAFFRRNHSMKAVSQSLDELYSGLVRTRPNALAGAIAARSILESARATVAANKPAISGRAPLSALEQKVSEFRQVIKRQRSMLRALGGMAEDDVASSVVRTLSSMAPSDGLTPPVRYAKGSSDTRFGFGLPPTIDWSKKGSTLGQLIGLYSHRSARVCLSGHGAASSPQNIVEVLGQVEHVDVVADSVGASPDITQAMRERVTLIGSDAVPRQAYDLVIHTPRLPAIRHSIETGIVDDVLPNLRPGGLLITYFCRLHALDDQGLDLPDTLDAFLGDHMWRPFTDDDWWDVLPEDLRAVADPLFLVDRRVGHGSYLAWLGLKKR